MREPQTLDFYIFRRVNSSFGTFPTLGSGGGPFLLLVVTLPTLATSPTLLLQLRKACGSYLGNEST
jgi:hypothetical protein